MENQNKNETPFRRLTREIFEGKERTDILNTREKVEELKRSLEAATEEAFNEFEENQRKSIEASLITFVDK